MLECETKIGKSKTGNTAEFVYNVLQLLHNTITRHTAIHTM